MTPEQILTLRLLVAVLEKLGNIPGVCLYDEDRALLAEAETALQGVE